MDAGGRGGEPGRELNPQDISLQDGLGGRRRSSNMVRVYVSSALADMTQERRILLEKVSPELLDFCRARGLNFEMVDPCWGLRSVPFGEHETVEILKEEIEASRRLSAGPSFIALLGNRYGQRPLPRQISEEIFQVLLSRVTDPEGAELLRRWYLLDSNQVPPTYILQPIAAPSPHYADPRPEAAPRRDKSALAWRLTETRLLQLLRSAASKARDDGDVTAEQTRDFYSSVLEQELEAGLSSAPGPSVLAVLREDPRQPEGPGRLSRLLHAAVDGEGRSLMAALKSRLHAMPRLHIVQLGGAGADPRKPEHGRYLTAFCQEVMSHLKVELDGCRSDGSSLEEDEEARFHDELCTRLAEGVQGRDGLLEELRLAVWERPRPLVVHGGAGMGKTALLCRLARTLAQGTTIVVIRLLAARHPLAPDINDVILSVCRQLCAALQLAPPVTAAEPARHFLDVLREASRRGATVLVVLDSLDSLSDHCHASKLRWLPARLPPNVHLLASADDGGMALANARLKLDDSCFFRVGGVSLEDGERLVEAWLGVARRKLTAEQREAVGRSLEAASGGLLYGRLAVAVALRWASFTAKAELRLGADLQDMLMLMMLALERRHGPRLVGGALGYIALAREGLLEAELRDLLSLDDDVISEVYRLSPPPSPSLIRLPPLLWSRLRRDLQDLLEERWIRGTALLAFSSRRISDFVASRYLAPEQRGRSHRNMADYFLGRWAGKLKPASLPGLSLVLSDRKVPPQPLWFAAGLANVRKLKELPYQLLHAGMWEELKQEVVGSADFLFTKTRVCGVTSVTFDLDHIADRLDCTETTLIRDALVLLRPGLDFLQGHVDGSLFHTELLARLSSLATEFPDVIGRLCTQCEERLLDSSEPVLIPRGSFLQQPGGALTHTLTAPTGGVVCLDVSVRLKMLAAGVDDGALVVWSLVDQHLIHRLLGHTASVLSVRVIESSAHCLSLAADGSLRRWSLIGGEQLLCVEGAGPVDPGPSLVTLQLSENLMFVYTRTQVKGWAVDGLEVRPLSIARTEGAELVLGILGECVVSVRNFSRIRIHPAVGGAKVTETAVEPAERQLTPAVCLTLQNRGNVLVVSKLGFLHRIWPSGENSSVEFVQNPTLLTVTEDESVLLAGAEFSLCLFRISVATVTLFLRLPHDDVVLSAVASSDGRLVATGAADQVVRVWSVTTGALLDALIGSDAPVTALRFYYNFLLSASAAAPAILVWNTKYDSRHRPAPRIPAGSAHTALTQDGDRVFYVRDPGHLEVSSWSSQTGLLDPPLAVSATISVLEILQQSRLLACGLDGGTVLLFPLATPQETLGIPPPESASRVLALAACAQERRLAVAHEDAVRLFALGSRDGAPAVEGPLRSVPLQLLHAPLTAAALLAGERLLYGTACGAVVLRDFGDGAARELESHRGAITCVAAGNGGTLALVGSEDAVQRLWALEPLTLEHTMEYKGPLFEGILCASFSDCDRFMFTGSKDGTLKVWNVTSGLLLYVQYVYSPVIRVLGTRSGLVALTHQGSVIRETFRCPDCVGPGYNPLRNVGKACASYRVTSRDKDQDRDQNKDQDRDRADLQDFNPAQLHLMSLLRAKPSATCCLL